jgi:predicted ATPase
VAPPSVVLVGERTMRASEASLAYEPAGDQVLKGKSAPVPAWRALRVVAQRRGAGRADAVETPFVGRAEEFRLLRDLLHLTGRDPRARLVSVTGPAGIGKSRLAWELEKYIDGVVETIYWHRGRCPAYGDGVTFWALGEMVRRRCGLTEGADEAETRERIATTVAEYVREPGERDWIESSLLVLLGLEPDRSVGRELLFAAWRRFFEEVGTRGTTVLVFEDLQWADTALLDFIDHLLDWSKGAPILVVTLARPELFDRRPDWGAGRRTFTAITLEPLRDESMRDLLGGLVPDLPEATAKTIVDRADGIPLYCVEIVRMLVADGRLEAVEGGYRPTGELGDLEVPVTLRSLIMSRLDSLDPGDRSLLQDASVLGQSFGVDALAGITATESRALETRLRGLVRRELLTVDADPRSPELGQYAFVQSLTREVAYATLSRPDRRSRHLAAARHFESTAGDELAGVLAAHYVAAHGASSPGPEADAVATQARLALRAAADRAAALAGHDQAAAYLQQALEVTTEPRERASLLERSAHEGDLAGHYEQSEAWARSAIALYRQVEDPVATARVRGVLGTILIDSSRIADAVIELETAVAELPDDAEPSGLADALVKLARARYRNLDIGSAIEAATRALTIAERHDYRRTIAEALVTKGTAIQMGGSVHEAMALLRAGTALALRENDVATALRGMANLTGLIASEEGSEAAIANTRDAIELARTAGDLGMMVWQLGNLAYGTVFPGRPLTPTIDEIDEVLARPLEPADREHLARRRTLLRAVRGDDVREEIQQRRFEPTAQADPQGADDVLFITALHGLAHGEYRTGTELLIDLSERRPHYGTTATAVLAAALSGDAAFARKTLDRAQAVPHSGSGDAASGRAAEAAVAAMEGHLDEALSGFRAGFGELRSLGSGFDLALAELAMFAILGNDVPEARAAAEESLAIFQRMGAEPLITQARDLLETRSKAATGRNAAEVESRATT